MKVLTAIITQNEVPVESKNLPGGKDPKAVEARRRKEEDLGRRNRIWVYVREAAKEPREILLYQLMTKRGG